MSIRRSDGPENAINPVFRSKNSLKCAFWTERWTGKIKRSEYRSYKADTVGRMNSLTAFAKPSDAQSEVM